jgi:hypothetical protein
MNLPDNQQYGSFAQDDVDVVNKGLIDIDSIQTDVDLFLNPFLPRGAIGGRFGVGHTYLPQ